MVSHYPARSGGHRHCGSGDMIFSLVEEQDIPHALAKIRLYCLSPKHVACHAHTHKISGLAVLVT